MPPIFSVYASSFPEKDDNFIIAKGRERSKKQAEQEAAQNLLSKINKYDLDIFINRDKLNNLKRGGIFDS